MTDTLFLAFLAQHDDEAWHRVVDRLEQAIHPVDRQATRIWFHLFPMRLQRAVSLARLQEGVGEQLVGVLLAGDQRGGHPLFDHGGGLVGQAAREQQPRQRVIIDVA